MIVKDKEDNIALQSTVMITSEAETLKASLETLAFPESCAVEGFHIVEHILLRPVDDGYTLFDPVTVTIKNVRYNKAVSPEILTLTGTIRDAKNKEPISGAIVKVQGTATGVTSDASGKFSIKVNEGENTLIVSAVGFDAMEINILSNDPGDLTVYLFSEGDTPAELLIDDPYSFWITVAVPDWLPQFKDDANGQNRFEQLVRREAPAHIAVKFCWMNPGQMYEFETAYLRWLYETGLSKPDERELRENVSNLVTIMKRCEFSIRDSGEPCLDGSE